MKLPFIFGKLAISNNFTGREKEIEKIINNADSGINTMLISPRRWGKSSLVKEASIGATQNNKKLKVCYIDVFELGSESEFYQVLAEEVIKATSSRMDEIGSFVQKFMTKLLPKISYSPDNMQEFELGFNWSDFKKNASEVLDLAEKIAAEKDYEILICLDEFQDISKFKDPLAFQKKLRSHWQKHQKVSYILYGSKRHMMMDIFTSPKMPFYKFGDVIFLEKIKEEVWIPFIQQKFTETKKKINEKEVRLIVKLTENHPYYVQQLAQLSWLRTKTSCKSASIREAHDTLSRHLSLLFQNITYSLSITQTQFLKALVNGEEKLSSKLVLEKYMLGSSANISKLKKALADREILDIVESHINFTDPLYKYWLKTYCFNTKKRNS